MLFWIDLEMTGLNPEIDTILEIAFFVTTINLEKLTPVRRFVIYQTEEQLSKMNDMCTKMHTQSGLVDQVRHSTLSLEVVEKEIIDFLVNISGPGSFYCAGNSVWVDRLFLRKYMPLVDSYLHYRMVDVSTLKVLVNTWYAKSSLLPYQKQEKHQAQDDIEASLEELKFYKNNFFIAIE